MFPCVLPYAIRMSPSVRFLRFSYSVGMLCPVRSVVCKPLCFLYIASIHYTKPPVSCHGSLIKLVCRLSVACFLHPVSTGINLCICWLDSGHTLQIYQTARCWTLFHYSQSSLSHRHNEPTAPTSPWLPTRPLRSRPSPSVSQ